MEFVPLQSKIWLKKYDIGCILLAKDFAENKYLVLTQNREKWIVRYDTEQNSLIKIQNLSIIDGSDRGEAQAEENQTRKEKTCQEDHTACECS